MLVFFWIFNSTAGNILSFNGPHENKSKSAYEAFTL